MRVLVVDDDLTSRTILDEFLSSFGYDVATASDGCEAFQMIQQSDYRLVVSDWEMPEIDGLELCRMVRDRDLASYVYFILLTSRHSNKDLVQALDAGADDFIRKPFNPDELRVRVRAAERISSLEGRDTFIFSLAKLAESRDTDTGAHLERMREYSRVLADELSQKPEFKNIVDADYVRTIYATSPLHDIGKVGVPDNVLLKPGRLTKEEFEVIKTHTVIGSETLAAAVENNPSTKFYRFAQDIVLCHHERWDGKGYPNGLSGESIPLSARIVSVADVYDALTTKRVYKDAFTHEKAKQIIVDDSGTAFDPVIVQAFLDRESDFIRIKQELNESGTENEIKASGFVNTPMHFSSPKPPTSANAMA